jgi:hypothetical protein
LSYRYVAQGYYCRIFAQEKGAVSRPFVFTGKVLIRSAFAARLALAASICTTALATGRVAAARCARTEGTLGAIAAAMAVFFRTRCGRAAVVVLGLSFLMHAVGMGCRPVPLRMCELG